MTKAKGESTSRPARALVAAIALFALFVFAPATASAAPPPLLSQFCESGSGAGQCGFPNGIATNPSTGSIYVADNNRINEFSVWGVFVRAWGWGVLDGKSELQTCTAQTGCRAGLQGAGVGQLNSPEGIALDSSGDTYVVDKLNHRVQKFDPEGNFLLMFGGGVDQGPNHKGNLCTAKYIEEGDTCGAGSQGSASGQFGAWGGTGSSSFIAVGPGDKVYVGDENRIQRFDTGGNYVESIPLPGETVNTLAVDPNTGDLYASFCNLVNLCVQNNASGSKPNIHKLSPAGAELATLQVHNPRALTVDSAGNLYVVDGFNLGGAEQVKIRKFTPAGTEVPSFTFEDGFDASVGIAAGSACGIPGIDLYVGNAGSNSYIRTYGPPPNPTLCPPPTVPPSIAAQYATTVDSSGATLKADINPHFWPDATYYLQYGTGKCSEGGCDTEQPLAPGSKLTTATTSQDITTAGIFLGGLEPNTTYHYRFVAQSSGGGPVRGAGGEVGTDGAEGTFRTFPTPAAPKSDCPNQAFRSAASAPLPDCRAYEMVSPVDKGGNDVFSPVLPSTLTLAEGAADGQRVTFSSLGSFAGAEAAPAVNQYLSLRTANGWSARSISPPRANPALEPPNLSTQYKAFDENLCSGWFMQDSDLALTPEAPAGVTGLYRRDDCGSQPGYRLLSTETPPGFGPGKINPEYYLPVPQGFSADGSHTVFRASGALTPNACKTPAIFQVYVSSEEGPLRLVSILPNGKVPCTQTTVGTYSPSDVSNGFRDSSVYHAVSADGSRVFWTDSEVPDTLLEAAGGGTGEGKIYVRLNATQPPSKLSAGKCTEAEKACTLSVSGPSEAQFWGADREGATALYTASTGGGGGGTVSDGLFQFDVEEAKSQLIAKGVSGVLGQSDDGSRVYFFSTEVLGGANERGEVAQAGKSNLYLWEGGDFTFIAATLPGSSGSASTRPFSRASRLSPDGLHLAFVASDSLTGYDNTDVSSGEPDSEVFLYNAEPGGAGQLRCVSCNPSGARPGGRKVGETNEGEFWAAATLPGWSEQLRPSRLLTPDGNRLYFESFEALVPTDSNGRKDVYEWERAPGEGVCKEAGAGVYSPSSGGCLSLISSGQSDQDTELIDASDGGKDVFFATSASLLPQDPGLIDIYDARTGGGFPPPAGRPPACEGEACQGPLAPPNDPTPASSAFEGAGNVVEGKAKKKHKKKHAAKHKKKKQQHSKQRANHKRGTGR